jgi:hypothetical protein
MVLGFEQRHGGPGEHRGLSPQKIHHEGTKGTKDTKKNKKKKQNKKVVVDSISLRVLRAFVVNL